MDKAHLEDKIFGQGKKYRLLSFGVYFNRLQKTT